MLLSPYCKLFFLPRDPDERLRASELLEHPFVTIIADHGNEASSE